MLNGMKLAFVNIGKRKVNIAISDLAKKYEEQEISAILKPGNEILVQVKRNEIDSKGAKINN